MLNKFMVQLMKLQASNKIIHMATLIAMTVMIVLVSHFS